MNDQALNILSASFNCAKRSLPFTYLGLPLGITKPKVEEFLPLVTKCERRLQATSMFLSEAGRLQMTNAVFTSLPMFHLGTYLLPKTVIDQIDKYRKHCFWRGPNINAKGPPKAAWKMVCLPKEEGGLGVLNLKTQNEAMLLKNLHKFFNKVDTPWVQLIWDKHNGNGRLPSQIKKGSFWWRDNLKLLDAFKGMAVVNIQDGSTCLFWFDLWGGQAQNHTYPELFSFAKNKLLSVQKALEVEPFHRMFHLPLSEEAFQQMELLHQLLQEQHFSDSTDLWHYIWGSPLFSSKKAYLHLTGHAQVHAVFSWLWKSSCQNKYKVFFWLLLSNTGQEETLEHLFNAHLLYHVGICYIFKSHFKQQFWKLLTV